MTLLAINIPTYERLVSFSAIMIELENDLNSLSRTHKNMIKVRVFDNNSCVSSQKRNLCSEIAFRSEICIEFFANETNIGGDRNILQCCTASPDALFTWVLGDDDHVLTGSLPRIISTLQEQETTLGLLIVKDNVYACNPFFTNVLFDSYEHFSRSALAHQPHLLIAHTLISCNIFRTKLFDADEAEYVLNKLTPRAGLTANFVHMRGLVRGLLASENKYSVLMPNFIVLDTSMRLPSEFDLTAEMPRIYYFYYLWLLVEIGVRIEEIPRHKAMWWLFGNIKLRGLKKWFRSPFTPKYVNERAP